MAREKIKVRQEGEDPLKRVPIPGQGVFPAMGDILEVTRPEDAPRGQQGPPSARESVNSIVRYGMGWRR